MGQGDRSSHAALKAPPSWLLAQCQPHVLTLIAPVPFHTRTGCAGQGAAHGIQQGRPAEHLLCGLWPPAHVRLRGVMLMFRANRLQQPPPRACAACMCAAHHRNHPPQLEHESGTQHKHARTPAEAAGSPSLFLPPRGATAARFFRPAMQDCLRYGGGSKKGTFLRDTVSSYAASRSGPDKYFAREQRLMTSPSKPTAVIGFLFTPQS